MITQKFIYEAAQRAFGEHHPKFPFPKKHDLDGQSDRFKRAFLQFSADINAENEREKKAAYDRGVKQGAINQRNDDYLVRLKKEESTKTVWSFILGVVIGAAIIWLML